MPAHRNPFKFGFLAVFFLVVLAVCGTIVYFYLEGSTEDTAWTARWDELREAVALAGTPLVESPQTVSRGYDEEAARLIFLHNSKPQFENPQLAKAWEHIETDTGKGLLILYRIGELDGAKPTGWAVLAKTLQDGDLVNQEARDPSLLPISTESDKSHLEQEFRDSDASLKTSIGGLQLAANGLTRQNILNAIAVRYLPSKDVSSHADIVEIQNTSGSSLGNATVFVTVRMKDGSSKVHVHSVNQWRSGAWLRAMYPSQPTEYASALTGPDPASVDVVAYLPSGAARATYAFPAQN